MNYTFDGTNKIIVPADAPVGNEIALDVKDLYSRWVDWAATSDNAKYLQAMRNVGGDPLPGSKQLGITFFLLNGWKIRPYEANHVFVLNGNIYSEDGSNPYIPTLGAYNVTIINSVSNLVDSTVQQLPEIEFASYQDQVHVDANSPYSGTAYPVGKHSHPVNNLSDALLIAANIGVGTITVNSDLTIQTGINIDNLTIRSDNWSVITIQAGVAMENTQFVNVSLYGVMEGFWNVLTDCWIYDITNFCGWLRGGSFVSIALAPYTVDSAGQSFFDDVKPMFPGISSIISMNTDTVVALTGHTDITTVEDLETGSSVICGLAGGKLIVDVTCTGGTIIASGVGALVNNSALPINIDGMAGSGSGGTPGPGGGGGVITVIGDTIIVSDETAVTISELTDAEATVSELVNEILSDPDTNIELPLDNTTATVEPDSTLGDS